MVEKLSRDLSETQAALFEEGQQKGKLQMELDAKESEIEQLRQKLAVSDNVSINSSHLEDGDVSLTSACKYIIICKYVRTWKYIINYCNVRNYMLVYNNMQEHNNVSL